MRARPCAADSAEAALTVVSDLYTLHGSFLTICSRRPERFCGTEQATGHGMGMAFAVHRGTATCILSANLDAGELVDDFAGSMFHYRLELPPQMQLTCAADRSYRRVFTS